MERELPLMPVLYKDGLFRIIVAVLGTHFLSVFGHEMDSIELMLTINYWIALVFGSLIAWSGLTIIYRVTVYLDVRYDWYEYTLARVGLQFVGGWIFPLICMFLFAAGYFALFGFNILESDYMKLDFPVIAILMLLANAYYIIYYFHLHNKALRIRLEKPSLSVPARAFFIVHTPIRSIPVKIDDISYIYILGGTVFLRTVEMISLQESYTIPETLKEMEDVLEQSQHFRINRQMIVNFNAVAYFKVGKNQTLELMLQPCLTADKLSDVPAELKRLCIVSEDRVAAFKKWMDR